MTKKHSPIDILKNVLNSKCGRSHGLLPPPLYLLPHDLFLFFKAGPVATVTFCNIFTMIVPKYKHALISIMYT